MFQITQQDQVAILTMQHGKANVMDLEFCEGLTARLEQLIETPARAIVLTGEGRIFSAGVDLLRILKGGADYARVFLPALSRLFVTLFSLPKPVVAAVNGPAIAGGCVLACAADYRLMASGGGRIGVPELLVGVPFPTSAAEIMRFTASPQHLQMLLYTGALALPDEAREKGLVDALAEPDKLLERSLAIAAQLASLQADAFALTKRQLREPTMRRIREDGPGFDRAAEELWASPATHAAIQDYVTRTFKPAR